jgi:hypothetical protein
MQQPFDMNSRDNCADPFQRSFEALDIVIVNTHCISAKLPELLDNAFPLLGRFFTKEPVLRNSAAIIAQVRQKGRQWQRFYILTFL